MFEFSEPNRPRLVATVAREPAESSWLGPSGQLLVTAHADGTVRLSTMTDAKATTAFSATG